MAGIPIQGSFIQGSQVGGAALQGGSGTGISLQGGSSPQHASTMPVQGSTYNPQITANPNNFIDPTPNAAVTAPSTTSTAIDPATAAANAAAAAAAQAAAAKAAQAAALRGQIGDLANSVKSIYDGRYGGVDTSAAEQTGKLNDRFSTESNSLEQQVGDQNQQAGAAFAGNGSFDSSYRGNAQDRITQAGNQQVDSLGNELHDNIAKIAQWVQQQKAGFDAGKGAMDTIVGHLADETEPTNLITLRNQIDSQLATLKGQAADNNTEASNIATLDSIAPSSARGVQLQTTLKTILGGNADPTTKAAIGSQLIASANLTPSDQSKLLQGFHADLAAASQPSQQQQIPTA